MRIVSFIVIIVCFLITPIVCLPQDNVHLSEPAMRTKQLVEIIMNGDGVSIASLWTDNPAGKENLQKLQGMAALSIKQLNEQKHGAVCKSLRIVKSDVYVLKPDIPRPIVCVHLEIQGLNDAGEILALPPIKLRIGFCWEKERGEWRANDVVDVDKAIAQELTMASSEKARKSTLLAVKPLIEESTILTVRALAMQAIHRKDYAEGHRLADITMEASLCVGHKGQEADAYVAHGIAYLEAKQYPRAMSAFWNSIQIFEAIHDRRAVGLALINYGSTAQEAGDFTLALEVFQSAIATLHQTHDPIEYRAWQAIAGAWEKTDNPGKALQAYQSYYRMLDKQTTDVSTMLDALAHITIAAISASKRAEAIWAMEQMQLQADRKGDKALRKDLDNFIAFERAKLGL